MITIHDITTRELTKAFKTREHHYGYDDDDRLPTEFTFYRIVAGGVEESVTATHAEIRAVLSTREHIPNKKDAKTLRRLQAQTSLSKEEIYAKHGAEFYPKNRTKVTQERYTWLAKMYSPEYAARRYVIK